MVRSECRWYWMHDSTELKEEKQFILCVGNKNDPGFQQLELVWPAEEAEKILDIMNNSIIILKIVTLVN